MSIKMFVSLFATCQIQFMVCLSSCHFKWSDECQSRCSSDCLLELAHQIQFMVCLSNCQIKLRDECRTRCSSYCLLHIKFNLWSVCQAITLNGEMDVNQDVCLIVCLHVKFNLWSVRQAATSNGVTNVKQDVCLIVCSTSNSIYGLSVKPPVQMAR